MKKVENHWSQLCREEAQVWAEWSTLYQRQLKEVALETLPRVIYPQGTPGSDWRHLQPSQCIRSSRTSSGEAGGAVTAWESCPRTQGCLVQYVSPANWEPAVQGQLGLWGPLFQGASSSTELCYTHENAGCIGPAFPIPVTTDEETFPGILKIAHWQKSQDASAVIFIRPYLPGNVLSVGYYHIIMHILHVKIMHLLYCKYLLWVYTCQHSLY